MLSLISVLVMAIPSSSSTYTTQYTGRGVKIEYCNSVALIGALTSAGNK